nr:hypothetical protein [Mesorhizobium sp. AR07]
MLDDMTHHNRIKGRPRKAPFVKRPKPDIQPELMGSDSGLAVERDTDHVTTQLLHRPKSALVTAADIEDLEGGDSMSM